MRIPCLAEHPLTSTKTQTIASPNKLEKRALALTTSLVSNHLTSCWVPSNFQQTIKAASPQKENATVRMHLRIRVPCTCARETDTNCSRQEQSVYPQEVREMRALANVHQDWVRNSAPKPPTIHSTTTVGMFHRQCVKTTIGRNCRRRSILWLRSTSLKTSTEKGSD